MNAFCGRYILSSLIKEPTCYKTPANPSCIYLILTNSPRSFQNSSVVEAGLSDFHRMIVTVLKTAFQRLLPKIRNYRITVIFIMECSGGIYLMTYQNKMLETLKNFVKVCLNRLNNHVPSKKKYRVRRGTTGQF